MKATSFVMCLVFAWGSAIVAAAAPGGGFPGSNDDKKPSPAGLDADYRLGAGDKLRIEVYKDTQLSQSVQIRPDGKITLPLVGDVSATGMTPLELRDSLAKSLTEYITNPTVTVIVVEAESAHAFVMGEVSHPGPVQLHGPTTVLQALAMAGGFKEFANTKDVKVLRPKGNGLETLRFNYKDVLSGDAKPFYLKAGDTVIVP
ncbi:MAG TPA: polysaccharide biosynthesis/export family protein [Vicinamibacterales bacterium]|nr:polysaccharide biosynthesis/export family protein [Vicinamibacterales bacterium]